MTFDWQFPTRVLFGVGRFGSTHKFVRGLGKRALVVTSRSFGSAGGDRRAVLDDLLGQLASCNTEVEVVSDIEPNPRSSTIDRAAALARDFKPRYVIGLGGGSAMDAAKCVALLAVNDGAIGDYVYRGPGRPMKAFNSALPIVCIPTVAATGSETSLYAVVTDPVEKRKSAVFNDALIPRLALIDPELTYTVGARQTVDGAFDMLTHVLETYLSSETETPIQDRMSEALATTIVTHLPRALRNPRDPLARSQLSWCAALALSGVLSGRDGGWPIHALAHGLGATADVPHGRTLAMILPRMLDHDMPAIAPKIARLNTVLFGTESSESGLFRFMKDVGAWTTLGELLGSDAAGTTLDATIDSAVRHALEVDGILKKGEEPFLANIRPLRRAEAIAFLRACL